MDLYYKILQYRSLTNYLLYLLPNMLSYAFVVNQWINKMQALEKSKNYTGLAFYYGMIVKNIFFFDIPEAMGFETVTTPQGDNEESIRKYLLTGFMKVVNDLQKEPS